MNSTFSLCSKPKILVYTKKEIAIETTSVIHFTHCTEQEEGKILVVFLEYLLPA